MSNDSKDGAEIGNYFIFIDEQTQEIEITQKTPVEVSFKSSERVLVESIGFQYQQTFTFPIEIFEQINELVFLKKR